MELIVVDVGCVAPVEKHVGALHFWFTSNTFQILVPKNIDRALIITEFRDRHAWR